MGHNFSRGDGTWSVWESTFPGFPSLQARYYLLRLTLLVLSALDPHFRLCLSAFFWISWDCMNAGLPKVTLNIGFPGSSVSKESACHAGEQGSVSGWGRSPGEGNGNPLQYSCMENPMDTEAWRATVHGVTKSLITSALSKF